MKKIQLAGIITGALSAAVIGFAGPAQAADGGAYGHANGFSFGNGYSYGNGYGYGAGRRDSNNPWLNQLYPSVRVPHVDTSVHN